MVALPPAAAPLRSWSWSWSFQLDLHNWQAGQFFHDFHHSFKESSELLLQCTYLITNSIQPAVCNVWL